MAAVPNNDESFAQIRLAPLLRVEALYLLGDTSIGFVICAKEGMTVRQPGFHAVERGELVILTLMTAVLESQLENGLPITYHAESVNETTLKGWYATITGPAEIIIDSPLRAHYQRAFLGFEPDRGTKILRVRPDAIVGHRIQRIPAAQ
ncbi:hypothetical protein [Catenulispora rubra]|uniref:hypothetical protein n=1 Tax=Catenulispora rubra TaxID=280293 RepID=UPI001892161A|nr:hypothetical protein [Catenulispora rubra]